jgi:hypothetical protein
MLPGGLERPVPLRLTRTDRPDGHPVAGRREWIGLAVLRLPTLLLSLDVSVLYLALPTTRGPWITNPLLSTFRIRRSGGSRSTSSVIDRQRW